MTVGTGTAKPGYVSTCTEGVADTCAKGFKCQKKDTKPICHVAVDGICQNVTTTDMLCVINSTCSVVDDTKKCTASSGGLESGTIVGIVLGIVAVLGLIGGLVAYFFCKKKKKANGIIKGDAISGGILEVANV